MKILSDKEKTDLFNKAINYAMEDNVCSIAIITLKCDNKNDNSNSTTYELDVNASNFLEVPYLLNSAHNMYMDI